MKENMVLHNILSIKYEKVLPNHINVNMGSYMQLNTGLKLIYIV